MRERKGVDLDGRSGGKEYGRVNGEETVIRIYSMRIVRNAFQISNMQLFSFFNGNIAVFVFPRENTENLRMKQVSIVWHMLKDNHHPEQYSFPFISCV